MRGFLQNTLTSTPLSISSPSKSQKRTKPLRRVVAGLDTMCTYFTLTYKCGHTQTSHRCPRSTVYVYGKNGEQFPQINGCDNSYSIGGDLHDDCIECKMGEGYVPGATTGVDKWSRWGPKEEALAARVKRVEEANRRFDSPVESDVVQGAVPSEKSGIGASESAEQDWEEQMCAVMMDEPRGQTSTPETIATSVGGNSMHTEWMQELVTAQNQEEEDDDWMWRGMNCFGGDDARK